MPLSVGTRLGPYEILSALGAGGMGEVYRARDTKLDRAVAIKILPEAFAADTERIARFQREAKTLASLNHLNIAHIHGLEESSGVRALVMELVEGEDLAERIARGAIPVAEALPIAKQMADALEAAHEQGIIHRDLKPANIKVRPDGTVKVLDFGLAKAMEPTGVASPSVSQSPTITTPAMTQAGMVLGTAAYMSPEQARGKAVDTRADIWAFGCVLYEMLTGQRAFDGEGVSETLARVIEREPDWARLPATTLSPALRTYIMRCLQKDPRQRVQAIGDVRLALEGAFETAVPQTAAPAVAAHRRRAALVGAAAIVASAAIIGTLLWFTARRAEPVPPRVSRLQLTPAGAAALSIGWNDRDLAITPDGSRLIYVGNQGTQIFVRALDALAPVAVFTGTPRGLFVFPDGQWIGFVDGLSVLKKVAVAGGPAVTLATIDTAGSSGATWGPDDTIIVATNAVDTGLQRVSAAGGPLTVLTRPDRAQGEADHFWPEMLPGGRGVLFTITSLTGGLDAAQVAVLDLQTGARRILVRGGSHAHYVSSGHLVYASAGTLRAVPFDLARLETRGTPVTLVPDVVTTIKGGVNAVVAGDGTLAYVLGTVEGTPRTLVWVDRQGLETPIPTPPRPYLLPALSPDGTRVAVFANDQERDLWLWDLGRATLTRLTSAPGVDVVQVWTPDSRRLIFTSERAGVRNLFWQAADGAGVVEQLTESPHTQYPTGVSPDRRRLIFTDDSPTTGNDVMAIELDATRRVTPLVQSPFTERNGIISADGRWLAYEANDSGRFEIYVRPFPEVNSGRWQVSTTGGTRPIWARSGQELVYVSPTGALMSVGVARGPSWAATTPTLVVKEGYFTNLNWWGRSYDISPDGQRFLMIKEGGAEGTAAPASIIVVQHWVDELKRLVPTK
ncbi:MAG TPA: protein kinase [Vicinamibacterales bacterium]|nr:protein kinase [Vicinamibacterales bacterium]